MTKPTIGSTFCSIGTCMPTMKRPAIRTIESTMFIAGPAR